MDRGKCKDPRATLILCAFAPVSGSAPVLAMAFGASADTSRRQEMQIGDLIRFVNTGCHGVVLSVRPSPRDIDPDWIYVLCGPDADGHRATGEPTAFPRDYLVRVSEVINASR
jgi:hypothetical protein